MDSGTSGQMDSRRLLAGVNPAERAAQLFAFLGMVVFGFVIGAWGPLPAGGVMDTFAHRPGLLVGVAVMLVGVAVGLARHAHRTGSDGLLRDPLTGLYRPDYVAEAVHQLVAHDDREGRSRLALVLIELDFLDDVRRRYGSSAVDQLLVCVGRQVRGQSREEDLPTRDADRFCVYLRCDELEQADAFSRRLSMLLSGEQFEVQGDVVKVSVSMGARMRHNGEPLASLQQRATAVLSQAQALRKTT